MGDELKPLSKKHQRVLDEYLVCWSKVKAYQSAYPDIKYNAAKSSAVRLFTDANFSAHFQARLDEIHMSSDEALKLLADHARGDLGDFIDDYGGIDLVAAREAGKTHLIKKVESRVVRVNGKDRDTETITTKVELHDPQAAIDKLLRVSGKLKDPNITINVSLTDD